VARLWPLAVAVLVVLPWARPVDAQSTASQEVTVNFLNQGEPDNAGPESDDIGLCRRGERGSPDVRDPLLRFDENLVPQPAAAESYDISADWHGVHLPPAP